MILLYVVALSAAEPCICAVDPWSSTTLPWSRAALVPLQTAATPSTPRCDLAFQMTCEFTYQWIYYLQDVCAASDPECASPLPLQIIGMALIPACNLGASKLCVAEAFIQWSYGVSPTKRLGGARAGGALVKTGHAFSLTLAEKGAPSWTIVRDAARGVLAVNLTTDDGAPLRFEIADDRGMSPQGNDGYVKSGFGACDTAYSCSFLRTTLRQVDAATPDAAVRGVGYGEWVHGTMPPQNASVLLAPKQNALALAPSNAPRNAPTPPPNATTSTGWHCFYLHLTTANGTADLDMCHSHNPAMAQFQRVQMLTPNGTRVWAEGPGAAQATPLRWWTSAATNATFAVVWRVHVPPPLDMWVLATPVRDDQEVIIGNASNGSAFSFYDGATTLTAESSSSSSVLVGGGGEKIGFGITEVFNFTSSATAMGGGVGLGGEGAPSFAVARGLAIARALAGRRPR